MSRLIECTDCKKPMGEIKDACLRTGIKYLCSQCDKRRLDLSIELYKLKNNPINDIFGSRMFGK